MRSKPVIMLLQKLILIHVGLDHERLSVTRGGSCGLNTSATHVHGESNFVRGVDGIVRSTPTLPIENIAGLIFTSGLQNETNPGNPITLGPPFEFAR